MSIHAGFFGDAHPRRLALISASAAAACSDGAPALQGPPDRSAYHHRPPPPPADAHSSCSWAGTSGLRRARPGRHCRSNGGNSTSCRQVSTTGDNAYFNVTAAISGIATTRDGDATEPPLPEPGHHDTSTGRCLSLTISRTAPGRGCGVYSYTSGTALISPTRVGVRMARSIPCGWYRSEANKAVETRQYAVHARLWPHPLFTSGPSGGPSGRLRESGNLLYEYGVDRRDYRPLSPVRRHAPRRLAAATLVSSFVCDRGASRTIRPSDAEQPFGEGPCSAS